MRQPQTVTAATRPLRRETPRRERLLVLGAAVADPGVVARYRAKIITVPGSECRWWAERI